MPAERLNMFHDQSGLVTVGVFRQVAPQAQDLFTDQAAEIPPDMVVVGGGALATAGPPGQLITASYPNAQLSAWLTSSKAHEESSPWRLVTYAIGLAIEGMTRDQLMDNMYISTADSGYGNYPDATAQVPGEYVLISGGVKVDFGAGAGSLATASFPSSNRSWTGRSKAHDIESPATIRSFAVCLRENLPIGRVSVAINSQDSGVSNIPATTADVRPGFALTGGGAEVHLDPAWGSLLWKLEPTTNTSNQNFAAASKAHRHTSPSTITTYALGIQIVR